VVQEAPDPFGILVVAASYATDWRALRALDLAPVVSENALPAD
jgi:hypothetical protein